MVDLTPYRGKRALDECRLSFPAFVRALGISLSPAQQEMAEAIGRGEKLHMQTNVAQVRALANHLSGVPVLRVRRDGSVEVDDG